jgi:hypothetical protein
VLRELQASFGPTLDELAHRGVAVDAAGAAVQVRLDRDPRFRGDAELLEVREYGAQGMTRARVLASAAMLRRSPVAASPAAFAPLDAVVERRAASLRSDDGEPYRVARIPSTADPAVYLDHAVPAAVTTVAAVLEPVEPAACPGPVTVVLELDEGRVVHTRRLREPGAVRRCGTDPDEGTGPDEGWWRGLPESAAAASTAGEELVVEGVAVRGATPGMAELVRWGLGRFRAAGLPRPPVAAVTFASATGRCAGIAGTVVDGPDGAEVLLCLDAAAVCRDPGCETHRWAAKATLVHELAHVWEAAWLEPADRDRYLERTGLRSWMGREVAWAERGGERAAEVLMWGLLDRPVPLVRLGEPSEAALTAEFRALTGVDPVAGRGHRQPRSSVPTRSAAS